MDFNGAKAAIFNKDKILTLLRDDIPSISYPNHWDFPGGGREGNETPFETIAREVMEEFSITVAPEQVKWERVFPSVDHPTKQSVFFVIEISEKQVLGIEFGNEGQKWQLMEPEEFLALDNAVEGMKIRLQTYFERHE